jgi:hypothetical protein
MIRAVSQILLATGAMALAGAGNSPKSIVDLQPFRQTSSVHIEAPRGRHGEAVLVNLNPNINAWFLLTVRWNDSPAVSSTWHLENPKPREAQILADEKYPAGLVISEAGSRYSCNLFGTASSADVLEQARSSTVVYYPLCEGRLFVRNPVRGARTTLETATEFLRDQVWGGEKVIILFHHLMGERYRETGGSAQSGPSSARPIAAAGPLPALVDPVHADRLLSSASLGIALDSSNAHENGMAPGAWYPAAGYEGIYVSLMQPDLASPHILESFANLANKLDPVEATSLCYLIAFDLDRFDLGFASGTEYPGVGWSSRVLTQMKDPALPGPDGIDTVEPLVSTGLISPASAPFTVATFTGGFKRTHGAFRYGDLSLKNHGSHYGFIENGVVFSKLQPGLATIFVSSDGTLSMKTWTESDNQRLATIGYARQNGVPLMETDDVSHTARPGRLVARWGPGNWSGSEDEKLRTLRAGMALQSSHGKRFLIYAVFSDATPSAMARVFQAYQCNYAMLTDMNALEHTYLAVYRRSRSELTVDHLLKGMSQLDKTVSGRIVPRFLGFPDNRDFFYVMRRDAAGTVQ